MAQGTLTNKEFDTLVEAFLGSPSFTGKELLKEGKYLYLFNRQYFSSSVQLVLGDKIGIPCKIDGEIFNLACEVVTILPKENYAELHCKPVYMVGLMPLEREILRRDFP